MEDDEPIREGLVREHLGGVRGQRDVESGLDGDHEANGRELVEARERLLHAEAVGLILGKRECAEPDQGVDEGAAGVDEVRKAPARSGFGDVVLECAYVSVLGRSDRKSVV